MSIITNDDWQWVGGDYRTAFATTDDPRVVAVIERDNEWGGEAIDGDAYAPAWYWDGGHQPFIRAGSTFNDEASDYVMLRLAEARASFRWSRLRDDVVERWLKIFHETAMRTVRSSIDRDVTVIILNTPSYREHVGLSDEDGASIEKLKAQLDGDAAEWKDAIDGEVFGIGFSVNGGRVLDDDEEIDLDHPSWVTDIECWRFIGEKYAKESAARFDAGEPDLEPMLELPRSEEPGFIEHTDRLAEISIMNAREDRA